LKVLVFCGGWEVLDSFSRKMGTASSEGIWDSFSPSSLWWGRGGSKGPEITIKTSTSPKIQKTDVRLPRSN
jgi:hypothetical protein